MGIPKPSQVPHYTSGFDLTYASSYKSIAAQAFRLPRHMQKAAAMWRSIGSGFLHSYTCASQRIAAGIRPRFDPITEATLQAEDEAKRWERDLDRAENDLIEAVRSMR